MGLLKLSSLYKSRNRKKDAPPAPSATPKLEPLTLKLDFEPTAPSTTTATTTTTTTSPNSPPPTAPAGPGNSLLDDIFSELATQQKPATTTGPLDDFHTDLSAALALSQQLDKPISRMAETGNRPMPTTDRRTSTQQNTANNGGGLFGVDSIYSSYLQGLNKQQPQETSMFASLLQQPTTTAPTSEPSSEKPVTTQKVLDSDVSDSEEEDNKSSTSDEEDGIGPAMIKGMQPIMERRTEDHHLNVRRKIDSWRVDPEANLVELNENMIARMKDRHRQQYRMAAMRQQQQQMMFSPNPMILMRSPDTMMISPPVSPPMSPPMVPMAAMPLTPPILSPPPSQAVPPSASVSTLSEKQRPSPPASVAASSSSSCSCSTSSSSGNFSIKKPSVASSSSSFTKQHRKSLTTKKSSVEGEGDEADDEGESDDSDEAGSRRLKKERKKLSHSRSAPNLKKKNKQRSSSIARSRTSSSQENLRQRSHHQEQQQQEWDRFQAYQREQQLKQQYAQQIYARRHPYPMEYMQAPSIVPSSSFYHPLQQQAYFTYNTMASSSTFPQHPTAPYYPHPYYQMR